MIDSGRPTYISIMQHRRNESRIAPSDGGLNQPASDSIHLQQHPFAAATRQATQRKIAS
jgi:hypothetical protein